MSAQPQAVKDSSSGNEFALFSMLSRGQGKIEKALTAAFAVGATYRTAKSWHGKFKARFTYTITVRDEDSIYPDLHAWIIENLPVPMQRSVIAVSGESGNSGMAVLTVPDSSDDGVVSSVREEEQSSSIRFLFDGDREQEVTIAGHTILVSVSSKTDWNRNDRYSVKFTCQGIEARKAVSDLLSAIARSRATGKRIPRLYIADRWGSWNRRDDLVPRPLDSVILAAGVKEAIIADFQDFKRHEIDYVRLGIPYHRGYLFYGPPGSGKTSIAKAVASDFGMDVYYMPLSDLNADADLLALVSRVPAGCVLLLEDVDIAHAAKERTDGDKQGATLSGLLNAIDGVATPHGLIVMMTTNHREVLDEAVVRPGRVDMEQQIDYVTNEQLTEIFRCFTGIEVDFGLMYDRITSAQAIGSILRNIDDPQLAINEVKDLLS